MEKLKNRIIEILEEETEKDNNGLFFEKIYVYGDSELSKSDLKIICTADDPMATLNDYLFECFQEEEYEIYKRIFDTVEGDSQIVEIIKELNIEDAAEVIDQYLADLFYVVFPDDYFLNQTLCVDLLVDTGDGNYEFTLNQPFFSFYGESTDKIEEESALLWLARQQGYSKEQLTEVLKSDVEKSDSKFLNSVYQEVQNCTTSMNALTFFFKITLGEWISLNDAIKSEEHLNDRHYPSRSKGTGYLTLKANTPCGLYDPWNGAGSILEIALDKPVRIPFHFIDSILPDGLRGYGVDSIYGICSDFWDTDCTEEIRPMDNTTVITA